MTHPSPPVVGRLLRAHIGEFVIGTRSRRLNDDLAFGGLVSASVADALTLYGLIADIRIPDDDLVRQLTLAEEGPAPQVVADQRENRLVPVEIRVLTVGYRDPEGIHYLLPPRPPLSLTEIRACTHDEMVAFTTAHEQPGYLRHVVRATDVPVADLIAAHLYRTQRAHRTHPQGRGDWRRHALQYLIQLLRDDYELLSQVLDAVRHARAA